jgi:hypothetical protein
MESGLVTDLWWGFGRADSLLGFCYLQPTDTSRLSATKLYRGFESLPLRHAVWTAEKFRSLYAEIRETCAYFAIVSGQTGLQGTDRFVIECAAGVGFLRKAQAQSGFAESLRRMQCDQKLRIRQ